MPLELEGTVLENMLDGEYITPNFEVPEGYKFTRTPDELQELIGRAAWEFREAIIKLRQMEVTKTIREKQSRVILLSKSTHLLRNEKLRKHLDVMLEDPKFRWTEESLNTCVFIENYDFMGEYDWHEKVAKQAQKEFDMWNSQLMWYMSENKNKRLDQMGDGSRT